MGRPQQPELARSSKTDIDPDHGETGLQGQKGIGTGGETGPIPPDNQPGHHPPKEQDKPDLDAFAARLGTDPDAPSATRARKGPAPAGKTATAGKAGPSQSGPAKSAPSKSASRPAATEKESPAAPPKVQVTPAKRPAAVPGPSPEEAAHFTAPQPEPGRQEQTQEQQQRESFLTALMLLPLRETVKQLERLNEHLTERLEGKRRSAR